jgi:hypothetical protein
LAHTLDQRGMLEVCREQKSRTATEVQRLQSRH